MRVVTIILLGCCLLGFAGLVFVGNRLSTVREIAGLEAEINELKRQMGGVTAMTGVAADLVATATIAVWCMKNK